MTTMYRFTRKAALLAAATPFVLLSAGVAAAQTTPAPQPTTDSSDQTAAAAPQTPAQPQEASTGNDIVVTGSIIRGADAGPSPVIASRIILSIILLADLDIRSINGPFMTGGSGTGSRTHS